MNTNRNNVNSVYTGKRGSCMCGCQGKYISEGRSVTTIYNRVLNNPDAKFYEAFNCVAVDVGGRTLAVYFN